MMNVMWQHSDQSVKQLIVGHTTNTFDFYNKTAHWERTVKVSFYTDLIYSHAYNEQSNNTNKSAFQKYKH